MDPLNMNCLSSPILIEIHKLVTSYGEQSSEKCLNQIDSPEKHSRSRSLNIKGRAMELSDLTVFHNRILTPDDKTGMISEIRGDQIIPWVFLNSGPGNTTEGFKCEWMTIKDDLLYVGSNGIVSANNKCKMPLFYCSILGCFKAATKHGLDRNNMWVKTVTPKGEVTHRNWTDIYNKIKASVGISEAGYIKHEAVQWSAKQRRWFFLPRKAANTPYNRAEDDMKGTNLLISSPDLVHFEFKTVGERNPERGYSAFTFIPDTNDELIVALKTKEIGDSTATFITVFNINGKVILEDTELKGDYKFEGVYFI
ncbi:unnamed protein product [Haemonchus placei]|uniref:Apyrase n=1 Tax=Haemonchus placei TaxID=6290 RepID=A0A158QR77_HAEPC|nr:unnamed protein product [Haemonchus placei]